MRALFAALALIYGCCAVAQAQTVRDFIRNSSILWDKPTEPFRLIGNIYYVGSRGLAASERAVTSLAPAT